MAETPKKKKRPTDMNQLAKSIVDSATSDEKDEQESAKAAAGRKGGKLGGKARAESLSPSERSKIAKRAAKARWNNSK